MKATTQKLAWILLIASVVAVAFLLRTGGLFRGLESGYTFHPDEPKQVMALKNFTEGRYVWYVGSLFYDGYPLGLNHVDEWLLRPAVALHHALIGHVTPDSPNASHFDKTEIYYWARGLRVFYSLLCLGLLALAAQRLFNARGATVAALGLLAAAPIPIAVAHFATGDMGADLFTLATIVFLCLHTARLRTGWLAGAGVSVGLAFACKYNGALAGVALGLYILLTFLHNRRFGQLLCSGLTALTGIVTGMILGTPAFLVNPHRTWQDIRANFAFIRDYNVSAEFLSKPTWERIFISLTDNTPRIISSLGWMITLLAFAGMILAAVRLRQARRNDFPREPELARATLMASLITFPFIALALSLTGKPEVQPFHFAYLQAPLTLGAIYTLNALGRSPSLRGQLAAGMLLFFALLEFGITTEQERFFWIRGDNLMWKNHLSALLQAPLSSAPQGAIKTVYLEPTGVAVFRNRAAQITFPNAEFWRQIGVAPVPSVPLSVDQDWIFPNGPVFPLNDRMFRIAQNRPATRQVVFHSEPGPVHLGVRSGSWPSDITLDFGGEKRDIRLAPHSQTVLTLTPQHRRHVAGIPAVPGGSFIVPLTVRTTTGAAVVTVMTTEQETHTFKLFGGAITNRSMLRPSDIPTPETIREIASLRYLEGDEHTDIVENEGKLHGYRFPEEGLVLPCGPYLFRCEIRCLSGGAEVALKLDDFHQFKELTAFEDILTLQAGMNTITSRFSKAFAPYESQLELKCRKGQCRLESWTLIPDTARIQTDLQHWADGSPCPSWLAHGPETGVPTAGVTAGPLRFGDRIQMTRLIFPKVIRTGERIPIFCALELEKPGFENFQDYMVFIHLLDTAGHTVHQFHLPVWQAITAGSLNVPLFCDGPENLPPGDYGLELGVYNARTEKRISLEGAGTSDRDRKKRRFVFGKTTLGE